SGGSRSQAGFGLRAAARPLGLLALRAVAAGVRAGLDSRLRRRLDRLALAGAHRDLAGAGRLLLRQRQREHAVLKRRLRLLGVDAARQRHAAHEAAVVVLLMVYHAALALSLRLALALPLGLAVLAARLALDRELVALDGDMDIVGLHARQRRLHDQVVVLLDHVDRHRHRAALLAAAEAPARPHPGVLEEPVHRLAQRLHLTDRKSTRLN